MYLATLIIQPVRQKRVVNFMGPRSKNLDWWPTHVQAIFAAIGQAMRDKRLTPELLSSVQSHCDSLFSGHVVIVKHVSGKTIGRRKGYYEIKVEGPRFAGYWRFKTGKLEQLSRSAAKSASV